MRNLLFFGATRFSGFLAAFAAKQRRNAACFAPLRALREIKSLRSLFFLFLTFTIFSCSQKDKKSPDKKTENTGYTISKDGIGDLKIGMSQAEVESLLNTHFSFNAMKDSTGYWSDTVDAKYKDMDVSLYFERQYVDEDSAGMQLIGVETTSNLCKTASGIGIGDDKSSILPAYEDNPIDMGPDWVAENDSTWVMSKTDYSIRVKDDKWDKELIFHLVNKKVTSLEATIVMGE